MNFKIIIQLLLAIPLFTIGFILLIASAFNLTHSVPEAAIGSSFSAVFFLAGWGALHLIPGAGPYRDKVPAAFDGRKAADGD